MFIHIKTSKNNETFWLLTYDVLGGIIVVLCLMRLLFYSYGLKLVRLETDDKINQMLKQVLNKDK